MSSAFCPHFAIGLTGGIASGKTVVSQQLGALGARIVDTDTIARTLTAAGGEAMPAIQNAFGNELISANGAMDRNAMRELAFSTPQARTTLETILHPMIHAQAQLQGNAPLTMNESYVIFVVPLLVGTDGDANRWRAQVQRIAVVDCAPELQITRLMARSGLSLASAHAMLAAQASRAQRLLCADDVLSNDGDLTALSHRVAQLHAQYAELATHFKSKASPHPAT